MTTRKRKAPEKKQVRRTPGLLMRTLGAAGGLVAANPSLTGGSLAFAVIFSFVAANALWYQPGQHPHPFWNTRDDFKAFEARFANGQGDAASRDVTTFKIEREPGSAAESQGAAPAQQKLQEFAKVPVTAPVVIPAPTTDDAPANAETIRSIQKQLANRGLYDGPADGVTGPKTESAILFFEESVGLSGTGKPSQHVLDALLAENADSKVIPAERPQMDATTTNSTGIDPVAAAINAADIQLPPQSVPPQPVAQPGVKAPKPVALKDAAPAPVAAARPKAAAASSEMVLNIQKGLANMAYTGISIDGFAGEQTRQAILHFEKHYRLPETGEPNAAVLKKLKDIGAL
jgi:peptidoglycan hydrolase-like protein with peptidoglycan-binding domain